VLRVDLQDASVETLRRGRSLPAVSPDGAWLLSVGFAPNERYLQIADGQLEAKHPRRFVALNERRYFPAWNADQTKVLFLDSKTRRLMIMNSNGKNHQVFDPQALDSKQWFSDKLAPFTLQWTESGDLFRVYRSRPDGRGEKLIYETEGQDISPPQWSADGARVAFIIRRVSGSEIITVGADGSWPRHFFATQDALDELKWSPDSLKVAWICRRLGGGTQEVWTADYQGLDPERVHVDGGELKDLTWSPAGKHLAVEQTQAWRLFGLRLVKPDLHDVLMVDLSDRHARVMTRYGIMSRDPAFSPQGVAIAYFTDQRPWSPQPLRERTSALVISQLY
jgi:Tol biopolymer transport system component